jgi:hypothetical protein
MFFKLIQPLFRLKKAFLLISSRFFRSECDAIDWKTTVEDEFFFGRGGGSRAVASRLYPKEIIPVEQRRKGYAISNGMSSSNRGLFSGPIWFREKRL